MFTVPRGCRARSQLCGTALGWQGIAYDDSSLPCVLQRAESRLIIGRTDQVPSFSSRFKESTHVPPLVSHISASTWQHRFIFPFNTAVAPKQNTQAAQQMPAGGFGNSFGIPVLYMPGLTLAPFILQTSPFQNMLADPGLGCDNWTHVVAVHTDAARGLSAHHSGFKNWHSMTPDAFIKRANEVETNRQPRAPISAQPVQNSHDIATLEDEAAHKRGIYAQIPYTGHID